MKYIQGQHKLNPRHAKWVEYLQSFHFMIRHKAGKLNKGADALSRRYLFPAVLGSKVLGFEIVKDLYANDGDFKEIYEKSTKHAHSLFHLDGGFLFKGSWLCIPKCGFWELIIQELYSGALAGHFGVEKTISMLKEHYYWPKMSRDVEHVVSRCKVCQLAKSQSYLTAFTLLCPSLWPLGRMCHLISLWGCLGHKDTRMPLWWWWTGSQR